MAKKSKKTSSSNDIDDLADVTNPVEEYIEDAVEVIGDDEKTFDDLPDIEAVEVVEDDHITDAEPDIDRIEDGAFEEASELPQQDAAEDPAPTQPAPVQDPAPRRGGFFPLLLGGLVAGGVGYGAAYMQFADGTDYQALIDGQASVIEELQDRIAALPDAAAVASVEEATSALSATVGGLDETVTALQSDIESTVGRIDALERRPNADGTLADTALAAFEADLQVLRDQLVAQEAELETMTSSATEQLRATREEAIAIEENAVATARKATARTVLAQIQSAAENGAPIGPLLADLSETIDDPVPDALSAVADGVPTLAALQAAFPDAARTALSVARREGVSGEADSGLTSFLRNQFDVRSTAAREGDTTDAILSRVEASLQTGQISDALSEVSALPDVVQDSISDWISQAQLRASALGAISELSDTLNLN